MTYERFCYLLELYKSGRLPAEGRAEFQEALATGDFDSILQEDMLERLRQLPADALWTPEMEHDTWEAMMANEAFQSSHLPLVSPQEPSLSQADTRLRSLPAAILYWRRLAVVAAAILLAIGGYYFLRTPAQQGPVPVRVAEKHNSIPGDKAVLTLGDGTRIVLDSASDGTLASQGSMQVIKQANGQLVYRPTGALPGNNDNKAAIDKIVYNLMETPRGGQYRLLLPDGTKVWLNSASSIRYPNLFAGTDRRVQVTGEAYFEVAKNTALPFIVETRNMQVRVLGTEFNLMAYQDEETVKTTLVTGGVKVSSGAAELMLRPGQQASLPDHSSAFALTEASLKETLAWKDGKFWFTHSGIKPMMRQIARWYDVDVVYKGELPDVGFTGVFPRKDNVAELLEVLEEAGKVHFTTEGNTIIVTKVK